MIVVFGSDFREYESLILPIALGAVVGGLGTGFSILLLAARKMTATAVIVTVNATLTLALALPAAALFGLQAAAWGIALGAVPPLGLAVGVARRVALGPAGGSADLTSGTAGAERPAGAAIEPR